MAVMKEVSDWRRVARSVYVDVPSPVVQRIKDQYTTERENSCATWEWWVNTDPSASWDSLARALYHAGEYEALEKVAQYLPKGTHMESIQTGILHIVMSEIFSLAAHVSNLALFTDPTCLGRHFLSCAYISSNSGHTHLKVVRVVWVGSRKMIRLN